LKTVFVSGSFNVLHPGHLRLFRFAKECGDGMTFTYACPMIKGTLYIYNKGLDKIDMDKNRNLMVDEFEESASQIDGEESESKLFKYV